MAVVVVLVIKPITMSVVVAWTSFYFMPTEYCLISIAVLKVLFFLLHTYQHFICILRMIYNNYCNMPTGSYANLGGSCFQEINITRSRKRPKKDRIDIMSRDLCNFLSWCPLQAVSDCMIPSVMQWMHTRRVL